MGRKRAIDTLPRLEDMNLIDRVDEAERILAELKARQARAYTPYPYQLAFHKSKARIRCLFTGNQIGKSFGTAHDNVMLAEGRHKWRQYWKPPIKIRVLADGFVEMVDGFLIPLYQQIIDPRKLLGGSWDVAYNKGRRVLTWENGSWLQFMSYKQGDLGRGAQRFAAVQLHRVQAEEHCPAEIWEENMIRLMKHRGDAVICYTPVLGETWEYDKLYAPWDRGEVDPKEIECFTATMDDAPHMSEEIIEATMAQIPDERMREVRRKGVWINLGGMVYPMIDRNKHVVPYDARRVAKATKTVLIDPHPSRTKGTAVLWCGIDPDGRMFCYRALRVRDSVPRVVEKIRSVSAENNEDIRHFLIDCHWDWVNVQETGTKGESIQKQYERALGVKPMLSPKTPGSKWAGIEQVRAALEVSPTLGRANFEIMQTCVGDPDCDVVQEFYRYRFKPQSDAMREQDRWKTIDEKDDFVTLCRYYIQSKPYHVDGVKRRATVVIPPTYRAMQRRSNDSRVRPGIVRGITLHRQ